MDSVKCGTINALFFSQLKKTVTQALKFLSFNSKKENSRCVVLA